MLCMSNEQGQTTETIGAPQLLELSSRRWGSVSMDFVTHLPLTSSGFDCIITFVDRFSKRVHFFTAHVTDSATDVADASSTIFSS